jgi:hypothetical protein
MPSLFAESTYRPVQQFDGCTECYQESALLDICEYVDDCHDCMNGQVVLNHSNEIEHPVPDNSSSFTSGSPCWSSKMTFAAFPRMARQCSWYMAISTFPACKRR